MKRYLIVAASILLSGVIDAQPGSVEIEGVVWEGVSRLVAGGYSLKLYKRPDLRADSIEIPYGEGWLIPVSAPEGLTRVLVIGELRVTAPDDSMTCSERPAEGSDDLVQGEHVEYLRYLGEGFGEIRFRSATCQAEVAESLGHFQLIRSPEVQLWLPVFYADGTSPGWLLHDGSQTRGLWPVANGPLSR